MRSCAFVFVRDHVLADRVLASAAQADEALWSMPWATRYSSQLRWPADD